MSVCYYPCPCGYYGDPERECSCSPGMVRSCAVLAPLREQRISGPLIDRSPPHFAGRYPRRPQASRRRALRALEKLPSDRLVPEAIQYRPRRRWQCGHCPSGR